MPETLTQRKRDLLLAVRNGDLERIAQLLRAHACFAGPHEAVKLLLEHGTDPNVLSGSNWAHRPLHRTVEHKVSMPRHNGRAKTVDGLWSERFVTRYQTAHDRHRARLHRRRQRVRPVPAERTAGLGHFRFRCDWRRQPAPYISRSVDESGRNALWYCAVVWTTPACCNVPDCSSILAARPGKGASPLYFAIGHANHPALAELLLERGADSHEGISLLHASCDFHFEFLTEGVRWLIHHGADPDQCDQRGQTALHKAALCLLESGADPERKAQDGLRPGDIARLCRKRWV